MKLSQKLKSIFTSGDQFTVLTLLNKLIKEVEEYEAEEGQTLYTHCVQLRFENAKANFMFMSHSSTPLDTITAITGWLASNASGMWPASGYILEDEAYKSVSAVRVGSQTEARLYCDGEWSYLTITSVFDFVKEVE